MKYALSVFFLLFFLSIKAQHFELPELVSPPQLVLPEDHEEIELFRPLFTWLPPAPSQFFNNLTYDWVLTEIVGVQTASDAIQQNIPLFTRQNIKYTNFQYPLSAPTLDSSKVYAWRVAAKNNMIPVANSEIWTFHLKRADSIVNLPIKEGAFVKLKREEDAAVAVISGVIKYSYFNEANDSLVHFFIADITASTRRQLSADPSMQQVHFGQNLIELDLRGNSFLLNKHIYLLQLINSRKEKWYLKFEYKKKGQ